MRRTLMVISLGLLVAFCPQFLMAAEPGPDVVGQILSQGAKLDGVEVPSGATILESSVLIAERDPALIHLKNGQTLELARNSEVFFKRSSNDELRATVRSGTLSYRGSGGNVSVTPPSGELRITSAGIVSVTPLVQGTVAVLVESARLGQSLLKVNDTGRINPQAAILLKKDPEDLGEVHYVTEMDTSSVKVSAGVAEDFEPNTLVVQDEEQIERAIAAGAAVVGTVAVSGGMSTGTLLGVSGAAAGSAAGISALVDEAEQTGVQSGTNP